MDSFPTINFFALSVFLGPVRWRKVKVRVRRANQFNVHFCSLIFSFFFSFGFCSPGVFCDNALIVLLHVRLLRFD